MNDFNKYYYIYRDATGRYNEARNPIFIAQHKDCYAIEKAKVRDIKKYLKIKNKI